MNKILKNIWKFNKTLKSKKLIKPQINMKMNKIVKMNKIATEGTSHHEQPAPNRGDFR